MISTPMSDGKFNALMARSLLKIGMPYNDANKVEYNTLRRFMPSVGECLRFDSVEAQSLSNWVDIPKGVLGRKERAGHPSSRLYAMTKDESSLLNKHKAIVTLLLSIDQFKNCVSLSAGQDPEWLASDEITWRQLRRSQPDVEAAEQAICAGWPWAPRPQAEARPIKKSKGSEPIDSLEDVVLPVLATQKKSKLTHLQEPPFSPAKKVLCRRKPFVTGLIEVQ